MTEHRRVRLFLSSAARLAEYREAISDVARRFDGVSLFRWEDLSPSDSWLEISLEEIRQCDLFVLLLGGRLNEYVRREFGAATRLGKPCLVFVLDPRSESASPDSEALDFQAEVERRFHVAMFTGSDDLATRFADALQRFLADASTPQAPGSEVETEAEGEEHRLESRVAPEPERTGDAAQPRLRSLLRRLDARRVAPLLVVLGFAGIVLQSMLERQTEEAAAPVPPPPEPLVLRCDENVTAEKFAARAELLTALRSAHESVLVLAREPVAPGRRPRVGFVGHKLRNLGAYSDEVLWDVDGCALQAVDMAVAEERPARSSSEVPSHSHLVSRMPIVERSTLPSDASRLLYILNDRSEAESEFCACPRPRAPGGCPQRYTVEVFTLHEELYGTVRARYLDTLAGNEFLSEPVALEALPSGDVFAVNRVLEEPAWARSAMALVERSALWKFRNLVRLREGRWHRCRSWLRDTSAVVAADGRLFVASSADGRIRVLDETTCADFAPPIEIEGHTISLTAGSEGRHAYAVSLSVPPSRADATRPPRTRVFRLDLVDLTTQELRMTGGNAVPGAIRAATMIDDTLVLLEFEGRRIVTCRGGAPAAAS